ncbi:galectin-4-like [Physella acuta]|uniref:galectin-4-like n=1 Tax=Physella acuta TaxID=109671 RepID=UPI0027DC2F28|nr:galectin-4-like [Physella acuta]
MGNNIALPYSGHIPGGVQVGSEVVITGKTAPNFERFSINLCTGANLDQDCALHFNPRFSDGKVVRNHKQAGNWGGEETNGGMPFKRDHSFEIYIKATQQGYEVKVNHDHFCNFNHRIPKESVQFLHIAGDCIITSIQPLGGQSYSMGQNFPQAQGQFLFTQYAAPAAPIHNPPVPFSTSIPGGLYPGKMIFITGVPSPNANKFTINLICGPSDASDISLHFDVRFNFNGERNLVVRNHKQNGSWGQEERQQSHFPFIPGTSFELVILTEPNCFKVAVNNQHFIEFAHRVQPFQRTDHVTVNGDISLSQVRFQ